MATFTVNILTPERPVYSGEAESVIAPAAGGYLGILAGHAPLIAEITVGELQVREPAGPVRLFAIASGLLRVTPSRVDVLADTAEAALARARHRLEDREAGSGFERAEAALHRALNRLHVVDRAR